MNIPEHSESLPPAVVVEHVLIGGAEHGDDGEDALRRPGDKGLDGGASLQLDQVEAPPRGSAEAYLAISSAGTVPARN